MKRGKTQGAGGPSVRTLKVGEAMRHVLADVLARGVITDPVLERHIVSISEVRVSPDLRHATAYIMPIGVTKDELQAVLKALNSRSKMLKGELARRVNTKYAAEIHFRVDESFDEASRIDTLLRRPEVARDLTDGGLPSLDKLDDEDGSIASEGSDL